MNLRFLIPVFFLAHVGLVSAQEAPANKSEPESMGQKLLSHHWVSEEKAKSEIDGSRTILFTVMGSLNDGDAISGVPLLVAAWTHHQWNAILYPANEEFAEEMPTITFGWDRSEPETVKWSCSQDRKKATSPSPRDFVVRLTKSGKLLIRVDTGTQKRETALVFDISGLKSEIGKYPEALESLGQ